MSLLRTPLINIMQFKKYMETDSCSKIYQNKNTQIIFLYGRQNKNKKDISY